MFRINQEMQVDVLTIYVLESLGKVLVANYGGSKGTLKMHGTIVIRDGWILRVVITLKSFIELQ